MLADVVADLEKAGLLEVSDGAKVVFVEGFTTREGTPLPLIVQKADGGYNYATTDLAAVRYRVQELGANRILYVIDHGQSQHMAMVFAVARKAGWLPDDVIAVHIPFGLVLGEDGKRLRTRSGDSVALKSLLDEAEERGRALAREHGAPEEVGEHLGLSALRYAELSHNRMTNYVFSFDKMVSLEGNTAPYLLYAYARINGIATQGGGRRRRRAASARRARRRRARARQGARRLPGRRRSRDGRVPAERRHRVPLRAQPGVQPLLRARAGRRATASVDALRLRLCEATAATLRAAASACSACACSKSSRP